MPFLTDDFNKQAKQFHEQMAVLEASRTAASFPEFQPSEWATKYNNCYNFILNKKTKGGLQPGALAGKIMADCRGDDFKTFVGTTQKNAISDGLRFLGNDFVQVSNTETPTALFLREDCDDIFFGIHNFHWLALRFSEGDMVWAHKDGMPPAQVITGTDIFSVAKEDSYYHFGGYFALPDDLAL